MSTPRPYQEEAIAYILRHKRVLVADEMGIGKSLEALVAVDRAQAYPCLIVCPASLKYNWVNEVEKWLPQTYSTVYNSTTGGWGGVGGPEFTIVNYDLLKKHWPWLKEVDWKSVVFDEAHYLKNPRAQRTIRSQRLASGVEYLIGLTGTPVVNRPIEALNLLTVLRQIHTLGGFWPAATRYCQAYKSIYGWDFSGAAHLPELNEKLRERCYIRRLKSEVLPELPPKQRTVVPLDITNRLEYQKAEADVVGWAVRKALQDAEFRASLVGLPEGEARARRAARAQESAQRTLAAEHLVRIEALKQLAAFGKLEAALEWIETFLESGEKLVAFATHRAILDKVIHNLWGTGIASITGDMSAQGRQEQVDWFQNDPECRLMVASLKAGGVGITLTAASNVAFLELPWTPAELDQAEDRLHRIGQASSVNCWYLLAHGTIDEEIARLLDSKRRVVDAATEGQAGDEAGIVAQLLASLALRKSLTEV